MDEATAQDKAGGLSEQLTDERRAHAYRQTEVARLQSELATLPGDVDVAKSKEDAAKSQLANKKAEFDRKDLELRHQLLELERGCSYYERLGLKFEQSAVAGLLRVVFWLIDPSAPQRQFTFDITVNEGDERFNVTSCEPPVSQLDSLVDELNKSGNFSQFVQSMRAQFKSLCMRSAAHGTHGGVR